MVKSDDIAVVVSGEAGQGLQTLQSLIARMAKRTGYHVFASGEVMSRIKGGNNTSLLRVSSSRARAAVGRIDILVPLGKNAVYRVAGRVDENTFIFADESHLGPEYDSLTAAVHVVPFTRMSQECGGGLCLNIVVAGFIAALLNVPGYTVLEEVKAGLARLDADAVKRNLDAAQKGFEAGREIADAGVLSVRLAASERVKDECLMEGTDSIGIGALAGGCNFVSAYPMSPSTNLLVFMARRAGEFELVVEQAEDEIAAVNMACGAWHAGGRALVTTSGGGFALMTEGVSLAGGAELPLVVHVAQRPGPATGLPTRTEQGDLNMVLHAGHGEFPRVIFAPGDFHDAIELACRAFNLADRFQVPVFLLTDQHFLDSSYNIEKRDLALPGEERHIVRTVEEYARYRLTADGVSPRGIPGYGEGLVRVISDEHDEEGRITEDFATRRSMVDKRMRKAKSVSAEGVPPRLVGGGEFRYLVVGWGSTLDVAREALAYCGRSDISFLHYRQVYPLPAEGNRYLMEAPVLIALENNATGQFADLVESLVPVRFAGRILKYDGAPFTVEELAETFRTIEDRGRR